MGRGPGMRLAGRLALQTNQSAAIHPESFRAGSGVATTARRGRGRARPRASRPPRTATASLPWRLLQMDPCWPAPRPAGSLSPTVIQTSNSGRSPIHHLSPRQRLPSVKSMGSMGSRPGTIPSGRWPSRPTARPCWLPDRTIRGKCTDCQGETTSENSRAYPAGYSRCLRTVPASLSAPTRSISGAERRSQAGRQSRLNGQRPQAILVGYNGPANGKCHQQGRVGRTPWRHDDLR